MAKRVSGDSKYEVEEIKKSQIKKAKSGKIVTEFMVKWKGYSEENWEGMDHVYEVPLLLKDFTKKQKANMLRGLTPAQKRNQAITSGLPSFPSIPSK